jgi:2-iminobutanoate/2-iminopropanoate deaminase
MSHSLSAESPVRIVPPGWDPEVSQRLGYSLGMKYGSSLWIAGQVAVDELGRPVGQGDIEAQTRCVFERLRAIVEAAGGTMADVVKTTTYITNRSHRPVVNELRREFFEGPNYPTSTLLIVAGLALPEYLVEVDAVAVLRG